MTIAAPAPGLVIHYSFLWSNAAQEGAREGSKDRPCAIVVAAPLSPGGEVRTLVVPITHALPRDAAASMELPRTVSRSLGLDGERHWIRLDELNRFVWPGYDLRPIPGTSDYSYGMLPKALFDEMKRRIQALALARRTQTQGRD